MREPIKRRRALVMGWGIAGLVFLATGCATPQVASRKGLLEGVAAAKRSPYHSRPSNRLAAVERTPAARALDAQEKGFAAIERPGHGRSRKKSTLVGTLPGQDHRRPAIEIAGGDLKWPLESVKVTSPFGPRGREFHEGIDLKAPVGTPVLAAQDGTVIYSGTKIRGYGKLVVIRHYQQVSTIYAHNSRLLVKSGQYVRQGQKIAISGKSGHVTGPHLHFEVRDGLSALNPEELLPQHGYASRETSAPARPESLAESGSRSRGEREPSRSSRGKRRAQRVSGGPEERVIATAPMPSSEREARQD
jgi:murein DD-endopeptidase MepM/ murein hydrolase activator NlpD